MEGDDKGRRVSTWYGAKTGDSRKGPGKLETLSGPSLRQAVQKDGREVVPKLKAE